MRSSLLAALLAVPAWAGSFVGPELNVDLPRPAQESYLQSAPLVAATGSGFLVVWSDDRTGVMNPYAARIDAQGNVLDPQAIALAPSGSIREVSGLACADGGPCLAVWLDLDLIGGAGSSTFRGARVDTAGNLLDPVPLQLAALPGVVFYWEVLSDGAQFLLVYDWSGFQGLFFDLAGQLVSPSPIAIGGTGALNPYTVLTGGWDGQSLVVGWDVVSGPNTIQLLTFDVAPDGGVLDPAGAYSTGGATYKDSPILTGGSGQCLSVWGDEGPNGVGPYQFLAARSSSGVLLDANGIVLVPGTDGGYPVTPAAAWDGTAYWVAWNEGALYGNRIWDDGGVQWPQGVPLGGFNLTQAPSVACNPGQCLAVWDDVPPSTPPHLLATRLSAAGPLDPDGGFPVPALRTAATREQGPTGACGTAECLLAWVDTQDGRPQIEAALWPLDGGPVVTLPPLGGAVDTQTSRDLLTFQGVDARPTVAAGPSGYLVAWSEATMTDFNEPLQVDFLGTGSTTPVPLLTLDGGGVYGNRASTFDGTFFWVVWFEQTAATTPVGMRWSANGAPVDSQPLALCPNCPALGGGPGAGIAIDATAGIVLFAETGGPSSVVAARLTPDGGLLDPTGLSIPVDGGAYGPAALTHAPDQFLVAWRTSAFNQDYAVWAARLWPDGGLEDPSGVLLGTATDFEDINSGATVHDVAAVWVDGGYLIAWHDVNDGGVSALRAATLAETGLPSAPFSLPAVGTDERQPALVPGPDEAALLLYERFDPSPPYLGVRARARWLGTQLSSGAVFIGDAGSTLDAGAPDAGGLASRLSLRVSFGCGSAGALPFALALLALLGGLARRRSRP